MRCSIDHALHMPPQPPPYAPPTLGPGRVTHAVALALAWLMASVWGTVVQTHFNLQALVGLGVDISPMLRALTTLQDLAGFGPLYAALVAAGWLPALSLAAWLGRRWPAARTALLAAAAGAGVMVTLRAVDAVAPMPVFIDATRSTVGLLSVAAGAVLAGAFYARRTRRR